MRCASRLCSTPTLALLRPSCIQDSIANLNLSGVEWLHLEVRPNLEVLEAIAKKAVAHGGTAVSIELEKERPGDIVLAKHGDVVMVSRALCQCMGHSFEDFVAIMVKEHTKAGAIVVCSLGDKGAIARRGDTCWNSPAFSPAAVVDTVGAGDTFNAALIRSLFTARCAGVDIAQDTKVVETALREACQVAGAKVGMNGFAGLSGM